MPPIFTAFLLYSAKTIQDFNRFHQTRVTRVKPITTVCGGAMLVCALVMAWLGKAGSMALCALLGLFFLLEVPLLSRLSIKRLLKTDPGLEGRRQDYEFFDGEFGYAAASGPLEPGKLSYDKIYRVYEDADHFYLYLNKATAFIVPKANLTGGSAEDFAAFLRHRVAGRYIVKT